VSTAQLQAAQRLLAGAGVAAQVDVAGHAGDVLVVHASPADLARLRPLTDRLRALGFRYVTVDLATGDA
jgi:hypothetical protein